MVKKNIYLMLILLVGFIFIFSNIYAYNLELVSNENEDMISFYTVVKSSENSRNNFDLQPGQWKEVSSNNGTSNDHYDVVGFIIHKKPLSHYENTSEAIYTNINLNGKPFVLYTLSNNYNVIYYDTYDQKINIDSSNITANATVNLIKNYTNSAVERKAKVTNAYSEDKIIFDSTTGSNGSTFVGFSMYYTLLGNKEYCVYEYRFEKAKLSEAIKMKTGKTLDEWAEEIGKGGKPYVYISFVTKTGFTGNLKTTADFLNSVFRSGSDGYGIDGEKVEQYYNELNQTKTKLDEIQYNYDLYFDSDGNCKENVNYNQCEAMYHYKKERENAIFSLNVEQSSLTTLLNRYIDRANVISGDTGIWSPKLKGIDWGGSFTPGYSIANDYDNKLYLDDILEDANKKHVYVDYLELKDGNLTNLEVAPKQEKPKIYQPEHAINYGNGYITLSVLKKDNNYKEDATNYSLNTDNEKKYEEYKLNLLKGKKFKATYMNTSEVNAKKKVDKEGYIYKYLSLRYYKGEEGQTYDELSAKIKDQEDIEKTSAIINSDNKKPVLVSFIYESAEAKEKVNIEVEHVVEKTKRPLPIAREGNNVEIMDGGDGVVVKDEEGTTDILAKYQAKGITIKTQLKISLLTFSYQDESTNENFNYNGKYKIEFYGADGELLYKPKTFSGRYDGILTGISTGRIDGVKKIKMTYYYSTTPPPSQDDDFKVCTRLEYTSDNSTITNECDGENVGYYPEECTDYEYVNKTLVVPTDMTFRAQIKAPHYYISDKYGIYQSIEFYYKERKIDIDSSTPNILQGGYHSAGTCVENGKEVPYDGGYTTSLDGYTVMSDEEKKKARKKVEKYQAALNRNPDLFGNAIIVDVGEKTETEKKSYGSPCNMKTADKTVKYHVFKFLCAKIKVVGFKGFYLSGATINNYDGESTQLIGSNKENVIKEISVSSSGISPDKLLNEIRTRFEYEGVIYDEDGPDYVDNGGYYSTSSGELTSFLNKLYDQPSGNGNRSLGEEWVDDFNSREYDPIKSGELRADGDKYNGERLSIAKVLYKNYFLVFNEKGEKPSNYYGHLRLNAADTEKEDAYNNAVSNSDFSDSDIEGLIQDRNFYESEILRQRCSSAGPDATQCAEGVKNKIESIINAKSELDDYIRENYAGSEIEQETKSVESQTNTAGVNILNPATMDTPDLKSTEELVSHTIGGEKIYNLQVGVASEVTPKLAQSDNVYGNELTNRERKSYIKYYIYLFNFPIEAYDSESNGWYIKKVQVNNRNSDDESLYDKAGALKFTPTGTNINKNGTNYNTSQVNIDTDRIRVIAVTKNVPTIEEALNYVLRVVINNKNEYFTISKLVCSDKTRLTTNNEQFSILLNLRAKIRYDANYISEVELSRGLTTTNISRVYGFRITDCTDVNYKNVFRKNTNGVNENTGVVYYSGFKILDVFTNSYSSVSNQKNTLPIGPYKHTNSTYVEAPKIGYRISFDLKTSGYYRGYLSDSNQSRKIVILPRLYYISKDGKNFIEDVDAYYKNAAGKYVKLQEATQSQVDLSKTYKDIANGGNILNGYQISFTPNDGYRNVLNLGITSVEDFFTKEKRNLNTSSIVLTHDMMCTNYDGFVQSWYGEYKLPNSTILVKSGETNLNNKLQDGYVGVIFYIGVVERASGRDIVISYNTSDKNVENQTNTTQWDYEGYLGFSTPGSELNGNLSIQLAKGKWSINNDIYQKIKGTVALFDLDNRAASDFD